MKQANKLKGKFWFFVLIFLFIPFAQKAFAQKIEVLGSVNETFLGTNISALSGIKYKSFGFYAGPKYHLNSLREYFSKENIFYKRGYAGTAREHWGLETNIFYYLPFTTKHIEPFLFHTFQFSYLGTRTKVFLPSGYSDYYDVVLYKREKVFLTPSNFYENNFGIGFSCELTKRIHLLLKSGMGVIYYPNPDNRVFSERFSSRMASDKNHALMFLWSIGLRYKSLKE